MYVLLYIYNHHVIISAQAHEKNGQRFLLFCIEVSLYVNLDSNLQTGLQRCRHHKNRCASHHGIFISNFRYAAVQQVPWIALFGAHLHTNLENLVDEVRSVSTVPSVVTGFPMPMNFWQRLSNTGMFMVFTGLSW